MRSLIQPDSTPPNPFPSQPETNDRVLDPLDKPSSPSRRLSPSDLEFPPPNFNNSNRDGNSSKVVPSKPKANKRADLKCDQVRERVLSSDIGAIELDVSPEFGVGPKDKLTPEKKRASFAQSAPHRTWYDSNSQVLAEGRLADFSNNAVVIEAANGTRNTIAIRKLGEPDQAYVFESWGLPITCSLGSTKLAARTYEPTTVAYKASGLCHKPLYFEEIQLERSGHEFGPIVQPAISTAHFFKNVAFLPYKMGIHPINECQYALGHYRPGNCAPWSIEPIPLSLRGAALQAKVITGAALVLP